MICPKCNTDIGSSKFCPECGTKIETESVVEIKNSNIIKTGKTKGNKKLPITYIIVSLVLIVASFFAGMAVAGKSKNVEKDIEDNKTISESNADIVTDSSNKEAQNIVFSDLRNEFDTNSVVATDKYVGNRYIFYFQPTDIQNDGICTGIVYDSDKTASTVYTESFSGFWGYNDISFGFDFSLKFDKETAGKLSKETTYKIEGDISCVDYLGEHGGYLYIDNITIIK